jgi:hypothetical protein
MSEFSLYMDDGGHPSDKPYVTVAGYIATEENWLAFEKEWRHKIEFFKLDYPFHMTDFMATTRISDVRKDWILGVLSGIVKKYTSGKFGSAVSMRAYERVNETYALEEMLGAPLAIICREIARQMNIWKLANFGKQDKLLMFMESGSTHYGDVIQVFKRDRLPIPTPVEKEVAAVQPADILAWEMLRYFKKGKLSKNAKRVGTVKHENFGGLYEDKQLIEVCKNAKVPLRENVREGAKIAFHSERKRPRRRTIKP